MENVENVAAALGFDPTDKEAAPDSLWLALLLLLFSQGKDPSRERELSERVAYLSGKVETLERFLSGA